MRRSILASILAAALMFSLNAQAGIEIGTGGPYTGKLDYKGIISEVENHLKEHNLIMVKLRLFLHAIDVAPSSDDFPYDPDQKYYSKMINKYRAELDKLGFPCDPDLQEISNVFMFNRIFFGLVALLNGTWQESYRVALLSTAKELAGDMHRGIAIGDYHDLSSFLAIFKSDLSQEGITGFNELIAKKERELAVLKFMITSKESFREFSYLQQEGDLYNW